MHTARGRTKEGAVVNGARRLLRETIGERAPGVVPPSTDEIPSFEGHPNGTRTQAHTRARGGEGGQGNGVSNGKVTFEEHI